MSVVDRLTELIREPEALRIERNKFVKAKTKATLFGETREATVGGQVYVIEDPKPSSAGAIVRPKDPTV